MGKLAINGGTPVRTKGFSKWPIWDEREEKALLEVLHSGLWGLGGGKIAEVERAFADYQQAKFGIAVVNGTITMIIALRAIDVKAGDEVIVPPYTFMATASAVAAVGATPVFVDVDPGTLCLDPKLIEAAITPRTKAIIPVHLGGHPADMDAINAIAKKHKLTVIEDSAHAHGAEWKGRRVGAIGDMGSFSFQESKNLSSGEGGMILTDNPDLANLCWAIHNCGRFPGGARYEHPVLGQNYRMTEFQAAILLMQMTRLDEQQNIRNANGDYLAAQLVKIAGIQPQVRDPRATRHGYHLFVFRHFPEQFGVATEKFIDALNAEGIPCGVGYRPLYREPMWKSVGLDYSNVSCPVTEAAQNDSIWMSQRMLLAGKEDMDEIVAAVQKVKDNISELA
jgi:dTDP-4-amino-4,6-dideoxygalactose transaminase